MEILLVFAFGARLERPGCEVASFLHNKNHVDSSVPDTRYLQEAGKHYVCGRLATKCERESGGDQRRGQIMTR